MSTSPSEPGAACLFRTRSAVLNVLIGVGIGIAVSGVLLRGRAHGTLWRTPEPARRGLYAGLIGLMVASIAVRRLGAGRLALRDPEGRATRFFRAHAGAAVVASLAIPLGLAYGWLIEPRLDAVSPFWVAALGLGLLALPRAAELDDFDRPLPEPEPNEPNA